MSRFQDRLSPPLKALYQSLVIGENGIMRDFTRLFEVVRGGTCHPSANATEFLLFCRLVLVEYCLEFGNSALLQDLIALREDDFQEIYPEAAPSSFSCIAITFFAREIIKLLDQPVLDEKKFRIYLSYILFFKLLEMRLEKRADFERTVTLYHQKKAGK